MSEVWKWLGDNHDQILALCAIIGLLSWINPTKNFIKNNGIKLKKIISFFFERLKLLFSVEFDERWRELNCLHHLNDCHIWINKDVIGDEDNKDYMISPMLLTIICNVIENEIENYCSCGKIAYTPTNYYDYLYYIKTGKIKPNTLDNRRIDALKNILGLCKDNLSFVCNSITSDKWLIHNNLLNIKPKWNI